MAKTDKEVVRMLLVHSCLSVAEVVRIIVFVDPRDTMFIDRMFANSKIAISIDSTSYAQCSYENLSVGVPLSLQWL